MLVRSSFSRFVLTVSAAAIVGATTACGNTPTQPTPTPPPVPAIASLLVVSTGQPLLLGNSELFTASVVMKDGTQQTVAGNWSVDTPLVASVDPATGLVTATATGASSVTVEYQGRRATKPITVLANFAGTWFGSYSTTSCVQSGDWAAQYDYCTMPFTQNTTWPITLYLSQTATDVSGGAALGNLMSATSTSVVNGSSLPLTTTYTRNTETIEEVWLLSGTQAGRLSGTVRWTWRDTTLTGSLTVTGDLLNVTRSTTTATRPTLLATPRSIADAITAMRAGGR